MGGGKIEDRGYENPKKEGGSKDRDKATDELLCSNLLFWFSGNPTNIIVIRRISW